MGKSKKTKSKNSKSVPLIVFLLISMMVIFSKPAKDIVEDKLYPLQYKQEVSKWCEEYGVDKYLIFAVIKTESGFSPKAKSSANAIGLMQMTEDTFHWIKTKIASNEELVFEDLYEPEVSIRFGTYFLAISLERYQNDVSTAAAAYHSGWGTVDKLLLAKEYSENGIHLFSFPYEQMNHYVNKINKNYSEYLRIYSVGKDVPVS